MKDFLRKLLASLLCICMIGSSLPVSAIAEAAQGAATPPEQQTASGDTGEEQGGKSAQTQETAGETEAVVDTVKPFNLIDSGIMPIAATEDFSVSLEIKIDNGDYHETEAEGEGDTVYGNEKLYWQITIKNNTERTQKLKMRVYTDWAQKNYNSGFAVRKPKAADSGSEHADFAMSSSSDTGTFKQESGGQGHNDPYDIELYARQTLILKTEQSSRVSLPVDSTVDVGKSIVTTVKVWKQDGVEDNATTSTTKVTKKEKQPIEVTKKLLFENEDGEYTPKPNGTVIPDGQKIRYQVTITNNNAGELKFNLEDSFKMNEDDKPDDGMPAGLFVFSQDTIAQTLDDNVGSLSGDGKSGTVKAGKTLTLISRSSYVGDATRVGGKTFNNTVEITNADQPSQTASDTATATVEDLNFTVKVEYKTNDGTYSTTPDTVYPGDVISYRVVVDSLDGSRTFVLSRGKLSGMKSAEDSGTVLKNIKTSTTESEEGRFSAVYGGEAATHNIIFEGELDSYTLDLPCKYTKLTLDVTVEDVKSHETVSKTFTLPIGDLFKYELQYAVNGSGWRHKDKETINFADHSAKNITYRIYIENYTNKTLTFTIPTGITFVANEASTVTLNSFAFDQESKDNRNASKNEADGNAVDVGPKGVAVLKGVYSTGSAVSVTSFNKTIECSVTGAGYTFEGKSSSIPKVTENLTLQVKDSNNDKEFGYSLAIAGADFKDTDGNLVGFSSKPVKIDDSDYYIIRSYKNLSAGGAYKYLLCDENGGTKQFNVGDTVNVTTAVPVVDGYTFIGWYYKYGDSSNNVYAPSKAGSPVTLVKDGSSPQSLDAMWMHLGMKNKTVVYNGEGQSIAVPVVSVEGEGKEYDLSTALAALGAAQVTCTVQKPNGEVESITVDDIQPSAFTVANGNTVNVEQIANKKFTDVGVYKYTCTVKYSSGNEITESATLTILPRPVVVQAGTGSHEWTNKPITIKDCTDHDTGEYEYKQGSAFEDGVLSGDASAALTEKIEALSISNVDAMLKVYTSGDEGLVGTDAFTVGHTPIVGYKGDGDIATESSKTAPGEYQSLITNKDQLATAADGPDTTSNYVFITVPGTLTIKAPTLATITLTKNVVDASFESGTFTFTATRDDTAVKFVKSSTEDNTYYEAGTSPDVPGDGDEKISLQVTANKDKPATETDPATASVTLKVTPGKYTFAETEASVTSVYSEDDESTLGLSDYTPTYKTKDSAAEAVEDDNAEVTVEAVGTASVEVTNTAKFYFVQNYISDLDNKGNPVKHDDDKNVLEGYPGYVADGEPTRYTLTDETTYDKIHAGAKQSYNDEKPYVPETFKDQSINSPNAAGVKEDDDSDGKGGEAKYTFKYDKENHYVLKDKETYNANKTYLEKVDSTTAVKPGDTVNIFWDRDLKFADPGDGRYVKDGTVANSNKNSANAIRQSQIVYQTNYMLWNGLNNGHGGQDLSCENIAVMDAWQQVNAIDLTYTLNKTEDDYGPENPRYIFNTVVSTQVDGRNGHKDITIDDSTVTIDNAKGGSDDTTLYLTPLVKVKYFIAGEDDTEPSKTYVDDKTYTFNVTGVTAADGQTLKVNEKVGKLDGHPVEFKPLDVPTDSKYKDGFVEEGWTIRTYSTDTDGTVLKPDVSVPIDEKILYHYAGGDGKHGIHVDPQGYLVIGLYLTPAVKKWSVTKKVTDGTTGTVKIGETNYPTAYFGDELTYTVTVKNEGNVPLSGLTLTDTRSSNGAPVVFDNIDLSKATLTDADTDEAFTTYTVSGDNKKITINDLAVGQSVNVTYAYTLPEGYKYITNSVSVSDGSTEKTADQTTYIKDWSVTKEVVATSLTGGTTQITVGEDTKTVGVAHVDDKIEYAIKITNKGDVPLESLTVDDVFTKEASGASAGVPTYVRDRLKSDKSDSTATFNGKTLTNLAAGETVTLTYTYTVTAADKQLTNAATVSATHGDPAHKHERKSEDVVTPVKSFTVQKYVKVNGGDRETSAVVKVGDTLTYEVVVSNTGNVALDSLTIKDLMEERESLTKPRLPDIAFTVKASNLGDDSEAEVEHGQLKNLAVGETVTLEGLATGSEGNAPYTIADTDVHIHNTVTLTDDKDHKGVSSADALVKNWDVEKDVAITRDGKPVKGTPAQVGDVLTYTLTVYNKGHEELTLFIEDVLDEVSALPKGEGFVSAAFDAKGTGAECNFVEFGGKHYAKITKLPRANETTGAASAVTLVYTITVTDELAKIADGLKNTATAHAAKDPTDPNTEPDIRESDPHDEETVRVEAWTIEKKLTKVTRGSDAASGYDKPATDEDGALVYPAVRPGDVLEYTVVVENTGSARIAEIEVTDTLKSGKNKAEFSSVSVRDFATYSIDGDTVTLTNLAVGGKATLIYTYTVQQNEETLVNAVTAKADKEEVTKTVTTEIKDWTVTKEVQKDGKALDKTKAEVAVGDQLTYVVTVKNTGTVALTGLKLKDVFTTVRGDEDGLEHLVMDRAKTDGDVVYTDGSDVVTMIPAGLSLVLTATYTVRDGDTSLKNVFTTTDPDDESNVKQDEVTTQVRSWTVEKTVSKGTALPGNPLTYRIAIKNTGSVLLNLTLKDVLAKTVLKEGKAVTENLDKTDALWPDETANTAEKTDATFSRQNGTLTGLEPGKTFTLYWGYNVPSQREENVEYLKNTVFVDDDDEKIDDPDDKTDPFPPKESTAETHIKNWDVAKTIKSVVSAKGEERSAVDDAYTLRPGDKVTYEVVVTNTGDETLTLYVEDSLFIETVGKPWTEQGVKDATNVEVTFTPSDAGATSQLFEDNSSETTRNGDCLIQIKGLPKEGKAILTYTYTVPEMNADNAELFASLVENKVFVHANEQPADPETPPQDKPNHNMDIDPNAETETPIEAWTLDKALTAVTRDGKAASGYDKPKTDEDGALVYPAVQIGDVLTYTITVENVGGTDIARLNLEDVFTRAGVDQPLTAANLKKDSSSGSMDGARLLTDSATGGLYIANLLKGKKIELTYTTEAVKEDDGAEPFINTVTVTSADGKVTAKKTVKTPVVENPAWEVTKTVTGMTSDIYTDTDGDGEGDLQDAKVEDELTYTITVKNTGNVTLNGLTLVDVFNGAGLEGDPVLAKVDTTETSAVYNADGTINGLGVGETLTLEYKYTVAATDIELLNKVTVSRDGTEKSDEVKTPVDANPDWEVEKTVRYADPEKVFPTSGEVKVGEKLIYRITITNTGNTMLSGLELTDEFTGKGLTSEELLKKIKQVSPEPGTGLGKVAVYNDKDQTIDNLGVGSSIVLEYEYTVAPNDATLENLVTVSLPDSHNVMHKVTTPVEENPAYTVIKQAYKGEYKPEATPLAKDEEVAVGDTITYRITIANTGNVKLDGLTLKDTFTGKGLTPAELMEQIKAVDKSVGSDAVYENATIDGLDVGEWIALEYAYTVAADDAELVNAVTVSLPDGPTEETEVTTPVKETPAYTVTKLAYKGEYTAEATPLTEKEEVAVGETVTYRIAIANTGNVALDKLELKDVFNGAQLDGAALELAEKPEGLTFDGKTIKDLGVGESVVLEYAYTVAADDTELQNTVTVTHGKTEVTDEVTTPVKLEPMYTVTKQAYKGEYTPEATPLAEGDAVKAGDTLTYVITVENTGKVDLKDLKLTDAFQLNDGNALPGVSGLSQYRDEDHPSDAVFTLVSNSEARVSIPVGDKLVLTGQYIVSADDKKLVNTATVADPEDETHFEESTVTTHVSGWTVEKTVTKTVDGKEIAAGSALPGSKLTYTVKVTNTGDVTLTLYLKDVLTKDGKAEDLTLEPDDDANAETKATFADMTITGLEPGKTFTLKCEYDVPLESEEAVNQIVNTVTVDDDEKIDESSDPDDPFPPQHDEQTTNIKKWDVAKSITGVVSATGDKREAVNGRYTLRPGDTVTYEVVVTNTGDEKLTLYVEDSLIIEKIAGAKWEDKLDDLAKNVKVTFEKENEDASWGFFADNSGEAGHDGQCLIVLKNLAAGRTATLTYAYTVPEMDEDNVELFASDVHNEVYVHANVQTGEGLKPVHEPNDPYAEANAPIEAWTLDKALTQVMRGDADVTDDILSWGYPAHLDDVLTYTITIANVGGTDIDRLNLKDTFNRAGFNQALTADELLVVPGSGMGGASLQTDAKGGLYIAGLKAGESIQLTFTATVAKTDLNKLVNTVTVTSEDEETSKTETVTTTVRDMSDWTVEKAVYDAATGEPITGTVKVGDTILYRITVTNTGNTVLDNLPLYDNQNDDLGKGFSGKGDPLQFSKNEDLSANGSSYLPNSRLIGSLLPNESIVLDSPYTVAPDDVELTNIATVFGKDSNEVKTPVEPTAPAWKVTKEVYKGEYTGEEGDVKLADGEAVSVGDALTYVITVENTGNTSLRALSVKDVFGDEEVQKQLEQFSHNNMAAYEEKLEQVRTLDVGRKILITYKYKVKAGDAANDLINAVTVTLPGEMETDKNEDHHAEVKNPVASLAITKEITQVYDGNTGAAKIVDDKKDVAVVMHDTVVYTLTITNAGSAAIDRLMVEDRLLVTGNKADRLNDMLLVDAPDGVTFDRVENSNTGWLYGLPAGATAKIECAYKVPGGVYYLRNTASAYLPGQKDKAAVSETVNKPISALVKVEKYWKDYEGRTLGVNQLNSLIGTSQVKFRIYSVDANGKRTLMTNDEGRPFVLTLPRKDQNGLHWSSDFIYVSLAGSLSADNLYRYDVEEVGLQTDAATGNQYLMINGHKFTYGHGFKATDRERIYTFTNTLEGATATPAPGDTSSTSPTPTPTPSAYVPFVPTPGPAADAKYRVTKTAVNVPERGYYLAGETVQYSIRVQNTGMVPIDALTITDHLSGAAFTSGAGYTLTGAREATIDRLSAGASVEIYASYVVTAADAKRGSVTNTVSGDGGTGPDGRPASGNAAEATVPTNDTTYTVTVHYVYMTDGTTAAPDDRIRRLRPGDAYRFNSPTIAEYYASMLTVNGTMPAHDVEITVYYVPEGMLPADGRGGPGLILLDEYGIPLGVGRVMLNVGDCFE